MHLVSMRRLWFPRSRNVGGTSYEVSCVVCSKKRISTDTGVLNIVRWKERPTESAALSQEQVLAQYVLALTYVLLCRPGDMMLLHYCYTIAEHYYCNRRSRLYRSH